MLAVTKGIGLWCAVRPLAVRRIAVLAFAVLSLSSADGFAQSGTIEEWAAERDTNFYTLQEEWRLTQPVTLTIRFALKHELGSEAANTFLDALDNEVGVLTYGRDFRVRPVVVPATFHYAMSIDFANLAAWRSHETSPELLAFVGSHWRDNVGASQETVVMTPPK